MFAFDSTGTFLWQTTAGVSDVCGVSVDPSGNPWLGDFNNGIQELSTADGSPVGSPAIVTGDTCHFAFDSSGNVVLNHYNANLQKFDPAANPLLKYKPGEVNQDVTVDSSNNDVYAAAAASHVRYWNAAGAA